MIKIYFKQAWEMLRENKLLSIISILGTALAICMIMVLVILYEVNTANLPPETHRDRMLYLSAVESINKSTEKRNSFSYIGLPLIKECIYPLERTEAVTAVARNPQGVLYASRMDGQTGRITDVIFTDGNFWKIFAFDFIDGQAFSPEEADSGRKLVVINESTARMLFGNTQVAGQEIKLNYIVYTIAGVVKDVTRYADKAYADIWAPYNSAGVTNSWSDGINGLFESYLLMPENFDRKELTSELKQRVQAYADKSPTFRPVIGDQPFNVTEYWLGKAGGGNRMPDMRSIFTRYGVTIFILLLVPALNLSGIMMAQMRKRYSELGVRRAFGARARQIVGQILTENLLLTLIGGSVGLCFSYIGLLLFRDWLLMTDLGHSGFTVGMFNPVVFLIALAFCLVMNLLSAGIPAWRTSKVNIVDSLKEK